MIPLAAMIRLFSIPVLAACLATSVRSAGFQTYQEAHAAAKQSGGDFVVFFGGPAWLPETAAVSRALDAPGARANPPEAAGWAIVPAEALAAENAKNLTDKPDFTPYDLPSLALVDSDGRTFAVAEGVTSGNLPQALQALTAAAPARARRDALFDKARTAKGIERAKLFGQGLDQIAFRFSSQRKDILAEIKTADPEDTSGYTFKYTFNAGGFHERVTQKLITEKKQSDLIVQVDKLLKIPVLLPTQRQALLCAKMQAYRSLEDISNAVAMLRQVVGIDSRSELGTGAVQYIRLLTEPVRLPGLEWESYDNRPTWLPMVVDLSAQLKEPGTYQIEFKHREGQTRFRKISLKSGGREIASESNTAESTKVRLTLPEEIKGRKIELWAESCGTGWFSGRGEIVITRIS